MNVIDDIIPEPAGGAHRDYTKAAENLGRRSARTGSCQHELSDDTVQDRYEKFRTLGVFSGVSR